MKTRLALFASGSGTNVQRISEYFKDHRSIEVAAVYCNKPDAFVLERAKSLGIPSRIFSKEELQEGEVMAMLVADHIDWILLAGFLWLIPENLTEAFPDRILNIHPALLPKYGGKGMYGMRVHEAVVNAKDKESGITIHFVNEQYDDGAIIFQARVALGPEETPNTLAEKIHQLEYEHFPAVVEQAVLEG